MDQKELVKKVSAGIFFIVCIVMIIGVVFTIGIEKGLTEPRFEMTVLFEKVGGLSMGAPVSLSGVNIGSVADISFLDENVGGRNVKVTLSLFKKYQKQLYKSSRFSIITEGVLGEKIIEISMDSKVQRDDLTQPVIGEEPLDVETLAQTFGTAAETFLETSQYLETVTQEMKVISATIVRLLNRIEQRIIDGNLFKVF